MVASERFPVTEWRLGRIAARIGGGKGGGESGDESSAVADARDKTGVEDTYVVDGGDMAVSGAVDKMGVEDTYVDGGDSVVASAFSDPAIPNFLDHLQMGHWVQLSVFGARWYNHHPPHPIQSGTKHLYSEKACSKHYK